MIAPDFPAPGGTGSRVGNLRNGDAYSGV